jgi:hypothetical protein
MALLVGLPERVLVEESEVFPCRQHSTMVLNAITAHVDEQ